MVWTGSEILIFGKELQTTYVQESNGELDFLSIDLQLWTNTISITPTANPYPPSYTASSELVNVGVRFNPATGDWTNTSDGINFVEGGVAVWCGNRLIVWNPPVYSPGGWGSPASVSRATGCRYDPVTDSVAPISSAGAPTNAVAPNVVWAGSELLVWGGYELTVWSGWYGSTTLKNPLNTGARYNPQTDQWSPMSTLDAPPARYGSGACWTGTEMLIWGGRSHTIEHVNDSPRETNFMLLTTGGRYNPATDHWSPMTVAGSPGPRLDFSTVWTGDRMIIWGGNTSGLGTYGDPTNSVATDTGGAYLPNSDSWSSVSTVGAPAARMRHIAWWTGSDVLVWGGENKAALPQYPSRGGRYNPELNIWTSIGLGAEPGARQNAAGVWTGTELLTWGGDTGDNFLRSGGRFDPALNTWRPITLNGAPAARAEHTAVWSGTEMLVWGGSNTAALATGGRYNPATDQWQPISTTGAPGARSHHTAIWSGSEMLVWGGENGSFLAAGGRYNPTTDSWRSIANLNEPTARTDHTAVWTGTEMIIWGGKAKFRMVYPPPRPPQWITIATPEGARYNPVTDTWVPMTIDPGPEGRSGHLAVWTGKEMIVWGGTDGFTNMLSGGRYSPVTDAWSPMSTEKAPFANRASSRACWDGNHCMVLNSGVYASLYLPAQNAWLGSSNYKGSGSEPRANYLAVWSGSEVMVWGGAKYDQRSGSFTLTSETLGYSPALQTYLYLRP